MALALAALAVLTWAGGITPWMHWGDDWAGYLMQARALAEDRVDAELAVNTLAMDGGDVQIGPYAYPWGYPLMLATTAAIAGWSIVALKVVGGVAILMLALSTFALARLYVGRALSAFATIAVALQPGVIVDASYLGSDVPFTALSAFTLVLVFLQWRRLVEGLPKSTLLMIGVALCSVAAFTVRANGIVLPCTYAAMLGLAALRGPRSWVETCLHGSVFAALVGTLVAAYFVALPDGSMVHTNALSANPSDWLQRIIAHVHGIATWVTFKAILGPPKLLPLSILLALMTWGVARRPWESAIVLVYLGLHLGLLTVVTFDGGERYYHPLLPAASLLLVFGCEGARDWLMPRLDPARAAAVVRGLGIVLPALAAAVMLYKVRSEQKYFADPGIEAPYAAATLEVMDYVRSTAPADARIAFFRPRAFRLLTGRVASAINRPENLDRVDWYVFNGGTRDPRTQIPEEALRASGAFAIEYRRPPYLIYVRRPSSASEAGQAARPPDNLAPK